MPAGLEEAVREVSRERIRGASWAISTLARGLLEDLESGRTLKCDRASQVLRTTLPGMGSLEVLAEVVERLCNRPGELAEALRRLMNYVEEAGREAAERAAEFLSGAGAVSTVSFSRAVQLTILVARPRLVYVLESRPGGEGMAMARHLRQSDVNAVVLPDSAAGLAVSRSNAVVFGADAAGLDGCLRNKLGTLPLAASAAALGVETVAVFESYKIVSRACGWEGVEARSYRVEGWGDVEYPVFEPIPLRLVSYIATELGGG
ncbi:putative translation initiation factor eIF-2B subunit, partial [Aeropyrum pernix]